MFLSAAFIGPFISLKAPSLFTFHLILLSIKWDEHNIIYLLISRLLNVVFGKRRPSDEVLGVLSNLHHKPSCLSLSLSLASHHPSGAVGDAEKVEEVEAG